MNKFGIIVLVLMLLNICVAEDKKATLNEGGGASKEVEDEADANPPYGDPTTTFADSHHHIPRRDFNSGGKGGG